MGGALCALPSPHRDSLLLETGFLAVLVAPLREPPHHHKQGPQGGLAGASPHEGLPFWLVRWLLFRLMFASGVVKLTSRCPAWWGLTGEGPILNVGQRWGFCLALTTHLSSAALTYHYETQCLPTPASWFAHQLPIWLHKLSVVATFLIEIAVPPLFFAPIRRLRLAAFYSQVGGDLSHQEERTWHFSALSSGSPQVWVAAAGSQEGLMSGGTS